MRLQLHRLVLIAYLVRTPDRCLLRRDLHGLAAVRRRSGATSVWSIEFGPFGPSVADEAYDADGCQDDSERDAADCAAYYGANVRTVMLRYWSGC